MSPRVVIAGGYGLVGGLVARHLRAAGHELDLVLAGRNPDQGASLAAEGVPDGAARLYLRPHDAELGAPGDGLAARVAALHRHADRITVELELAGQPRALEADLVATPGVQAPAVGEAVGVRLLRHRVYPA